MSAAALKSIEEEFEELMAHEAEVIESQPEEVSEISIPEAAASPDDVDDVLAEIEAMVGAEDTETDTELLIDAAEIEAMAEENERKKRHEVYAAQESELDVDGERKPEEKVETPKQAKAPKAKTSGSRTTRGAINTDEGVQALRNIMGDDLAQKMLEGREAITAVKIKDKAENLLNAIVTKTKPSVYVQKGAEQLVKTGELTSKAIVDLFQESGYNPGTAKAQGQQVISLFRDLHLGVSAGRSAIKLNEDFPMEVISGLYQTED